MKLIAEHGLLYVPKDSIHDEKLKGYFSGNCALVARSESGEFSTVVWPKPNEKELRSVLYDAREMGILPPKETSVILPDETIFEID